MDNTIYALDLKSGMPKWRFEMDLPILCAPIARNNQVILGSMDK
jgi:outer membrane protein assembly factor BamB